MIKSSYILIWYFYLFIFNLALFFIKHFFNLIRFGETDLKENRLTSRTSKNDFYKTSL